LVRHGETEENLRGIHQGHFGGNLSEFGIEQAGKLAERLKNEFFDVIYSSDLKRAKDTAKIISKFHKVELICDERLRERYLWNLQGIREEDEMLLFPGLDKKTIYEQNDVETFENMYERVWKMFDELKSNYLWKSVLCVGHDQIDSKFIDYIENLWHEKKIRDLANASLTVYEIDDDRFEKILYDDVTHLVES